MVKHHVILPCSNRGLSEYHYQIVTSIALTKVAQWLSRLNRLVTGPEVASSNPGPGSKLKGSRHSPNHGVNGRGSN